MGRMADAPKAHTPTGGPAALAGKAEASKATAEDGRQIADAMRRQDEEQQRAPKKRIELATIGTRAIQIVIIEASFPDVQKIWRIGRA